VLPYSLFPQLNSHGTYIIAGICKDGIVSISDSRTVFLDDRGNIGAYFDESPKIFQYRNIVLSMGGAATYKKVYFKELFRKFAASHKKEISVVSFLNIFLEFAKKNMIADDFDVLKNNQFMTCGYSNDTPFVVWHYKNEDYKTSVIGGFKSNNENDNGNPSLADVFKKNEY